jgi:hypothetical protein
MYCFVDFLLVLQKLKTNNMKNFYKEMEYLHLSSEIEQSRQERRERKLLLLLILGGIVVCGVVQWTSVNVELIANWFI